MSGQHPFEKHTSDPAVQQMLSIATEKGIPTIWDRYEQMLPQCGVGETGLCCRHCLQGPCRINPFEPGSETGICGASADVMVARGLDRAIAAGTAAHSGHAKHLAHTLLKQTQGLAKDYQIKDPVKIIVKVADQIKDEAIKAGADRINVVGICCTGNELMERHGIPSYTHSISQAIAVFKTRKNKKTHIPPVQNRVVAGFSTESLVGALSKLNAQDPLAPLVDNIKSGNIKRVCLFAGCNNVKIPQDTHYTQMAARLLKENVLVVATGCGAGSLMRHDFMDPARTRELCGEGLYTVLNAIGEANGLGLD